MESFTVPVAMRINTGGDLDIPAGAFVVVNDAGEYAGYLADDVWHGHRDQPQPTAEVVIAEPPAPEPEPEATAEQAEPEAPAEQPADA